MDEFLKLSEKSEKSGLPQEILVKMEDLIKVKYPFDGYEIKKRLGRKMLLNF